jgi:hypothetical protein
MNPDCLRFGCPGRHLLGSVAPQNCPRHLPDWFIQNKIPPTTPNRRTRALNLVTSSPPISSTSRNEGMVSRLTSVSSCLALNRPQPQRVVWSHCALCDMFIRRFRSLLCVACKAKRATSKSRGECFTCGIRFQKTWYDAALRTVGRRCHYSRRRTRDVADTTLRNGDRLTRRSLDHSGGRRTKLKGRAVGSRAQKVLLLFFPIKCL